MDRLARPDEDELHLARLLEAIANPTRLALLRQLRSPRLLSEIRLQAQQVREGLPEDRPMARQAVRQHLDRLLDAGFVGARDGWRGELEVEEYIVRHQHLFALAEEMRQLGDLRPHELPAGGETSDIEEDPARPLPRGRCLVVVHGLGEGRAFPLDGPVNEWIVGRQPGLAACLDYDPFVSSHHARLFVEGPRVHLADLPGSRNGTFLNWSPIKGAEPLRHGDIIGVGKSLLLFRE